ncbi:MAG: hypothetical protein P3B98_09440 [Gemmatimonadota bacterium]|nr:hypothetical protein [Gemmatimonadota bacterium]
MARHSESGERKQSELVPDIFDTGTDRLPSSGQFSAAMISGMLLAITEMLVAPLILGCTVLVSALTWWILDAPWAGRRRRHSARSARKWWLPQPRVVYLSTLMLMGLWLTTMFVFRASDPRLSPGFSATLPNMMLGIDVSLLAKMNGMQGPIDTGASATPELPSMSDASVAPFSLFAHGTASTIAVALLAYAFQSARRRIKRARRSREFEEHRSRHSGAPH